MVFVKGGTLRGTFKLRQQSELLLRLRLKSLKKKTEKVKIIDEYSSSTLTLLICCSAGPWSVQEAVLYTDVHTMFRCGSGGLRLGSQ